MKLPFAALSCSTVLALASVATAQPIVAGHYPAGAEGIKGASLPPPGLYFRDYTFAYMAEDFPGGPPVFDMTAFINAPRLIWMTDWKVFGASYGMDVILPFGYMDWEAGVPGAVMEDSYFGIGDIQLEPLLLAWHFPQCDIAAGYAVWAPTGDFSPQRPDLLAKGFWSHMLTLGGTYYFDAEKTWALSLLGRYEICHEQEQTDIRPGDVFTLEWGLSRSIRENLDVGLTGYWQQQTSHDSGLLATTKLDRKIGVGGEVSGLCPALGCFFSARYACEFDAVERPEGHLLTLTVTKRF